MSNGNYIHVLRSYIDSQCFLLFLHPHHLRSHSNNTLLAAFFVRSPASTCVGGVQRRHGVTPEPIGKERASRPPCFRLNTIAIKHAARGEEVGRATNASARDSAQKGGSYLAYRTSFQWRAARESRDGSGQSRGEWSGKEAPPS